MPSEKHSPEYGTPLQSNPKLRRSDVSPLVQNDGVAANEDDGVVRNGDGTAANIPESLSQKPEMEQDNQEHDVVSGQDSDSHRTEDTPEFCYVDLRAVRKEVQCPICLGIIKKTRTVMECLHRFCRECIDKSMRMGNNECPACRTHCASRRSLRDDPRFDELIAVLYTDIKKYEEEELAFYEEDEARNKQIQESITQVLIKQSEALVKKRSANKDTAGPSVARSQRKLHSRKRRRRRNSSIEYQDSDDNDDVDDSDKQISPSDHHQEIKPRRARRSNIGVANSPSTTNLSVGSLDNNGELNKEETALSPALTIGTERLSWGRGGVRSNSRHSNANDAVGRRRLRLTKLVEYFQSLEETDDESAQNTMIKQENVQHMSVQEPNASDAHQSILRPPSCSNEKKSQDAGLLQHRIYIMNREETLPGNVSSCISNGDQLDVINL